MTARLQPVLHLCNTSAYLQPVLHVCSQCCMSTASAACWDMRDIDKPNFCHFTSLGEMQPTIFGALQYFHQYWTSLPVALQKILEENRFLRYQIEIDPFPMRQYYKIEFLHINYRNNIVLSVSLALSFERL